MGLQQSLRRGSTKIRNIFIKNIFSEKSFLWLFSLSLTVALLVLLKVWHLRFQWDTYASSVFRNHIRLIGEFHYRMYQKGKSNSYLIPINCWFSATEQYEKFQNNLFHVLPKRDFYIHEKDPNIRIWFYLQPIKSKTSKKAIQDQLFKILKKQGIDPQRGNMETLPPHFVHLYYLHHCCIDQRPKKNIKALLFSKEKIEKFH